MNATQVTDLLVGLRDRGLYVTRPILACPDGSEALRRAVTDIFDHPVIQRADSLDPERAGPAAATTPAPGGTSDAGGHADSALEAEALLYALARELDRTRPSAAASPCGGLDQTLSVLRLGVPPTLARTLRSTDAIEWMISIRRDSSRNVEHWRDGQMALCWSAASMVEAGEQFRRVNGHLHLPALRAALEREVANDVGPVMQEHLESVA